MGLEIEDGGLEIGPVVGHEDCVGGFGGVGGWEGWVGVWGVLDGCWDGVGRGEEHA